MKYFDIEELLVDIIKKYPEVESAEAQFLSLLEGILLYHFKYFFSSIEFFCSSYSLHLESQYV